MRHVAEPVAWGVAVAVVLLENRKARERSSAVMLLFGVDWVVSVVQLHTSAASYFEAKV